MLLRTSYCRGDAVFSAQDVSRTPMDPANEQILTIITYIGCAVSSLFLGITVLTYTAFE